MDKNAIRERLCAERVEILASLGAAVDLLAVGGHVCEEDQAKSSHDEFVSLRLNGLGYERLQLVNEALERLEEGRYGECEGCGEPIAPRRLRAIPWARYCVPCQESAQREARERTADSSGQVPFWDAA